MPEQCGAYFSATGVRCTKEAAHRFELYRHWPGKNPKPTPLCEDHYNLPEWAPYRLKEVMGHAPSQA